MCSFMAVSVLPNMDILVYHKGSGRILEALEFITVFKLCKNLCNTTMTNSFFTCIYPNRHFMLITKLLISRNTYSRVIGLNFNCRQNEGKSATFSVYRWLRCCDLLKCKRSNKHLFSLIMLIRYVTMSKMKYRYINHLCSMLFIVLILMVTLNMLKALFYPQIKVLHQICSLQRKRKSMSHYMKSDFYST